MNQSKQDKASKETPVELYSIIRSLNALAAEHAAERISDKEFYQRVEEEADNLTCCLD